MRALEEAEVLILDDRAFITDGPSRYLERRDPKQPENQFFGTRVTKRPLATLTAVTGVRLLDQADVEDLVDSFGPPALLRARVVAVHASLLNPGRWRRDDTEREVGRRRRWYEALADRIDWSHAVLIPIGGDGGGFITPATGHPPAEHSVLDAMPGVDRGIFLENLPRLLRALRGLEGTADAEAVAASFGGLRPEERNAAVIQRAAEAIERGEPPELPPAMVGVRAPVGPRASPPRAPLSLRREGSVEQVVAAIPEDIPDAVRAIFERRAGDIAVLFSRITEHRDPVARPVEFSLDERAAILWAVVRSPMTTRSLQERPHLADPVMAAQRVEEALDQLNKAWELISAYRSHVSDAELLRSTRAFDAARFGQEIPLSNEMRERIERGEEEFPHLWKDFLEQLTSERQPAVPIVEHSVTEAARRAGDLLEHLGVHAIVHHRDAYPTVPAALAHGDHPTFPGPAIASGTRDFPMFHTPTQSLEDLTAGLKAARAAVGGDAPVAVLIDEVTQYGDVYPPDELRHIIDVLHNQGAIVIVDGAQSAGRLAPVHLGADIHLSTTGKAFGGGDARSGYLGIMFLSKEFAARARSEGALHQGTGSLDRVGTLPLLAITRATERFRDQARVSLPLWTMFLGECFRHDLAKLGDRIAVRHPKATESHAGIFAFETPELTDAVQRYLETHTDDSRFETLMRQLADEGVSGERAAVAIAHRIVARRLAAMHVRVSVKEAHREQLLRMDVHQAQDPTDVRFAVQLLSDAVSDTDVDRDMEELLSA